MKIVIIGGSGLIGSKLVARLREQGHEAVPASPNTGVDTLTGAGLAKALAGAAFGTELSERSLVPGDDARLGATRFIDWLARTAPPRSAAVDARATTAPA